MGTVIEHEIEELSYDVDTSMLSCKVPTFFISVVVKAFKEGKKIKYQILVDEVKT